MLSSQEKDVSDECRYDMWPSFVLPGVSGFDSRLLRMVRPNLQSAPEPPGTVSAAVSQHVRQICSDVPRNFSYVIDKAIGKHHLVTVRGSDESTVFDRGSFSHL